MARSNIVKMPVTAKIGITNFGGRGVDSSSSEVVELGQEFFSGVARGKVTSVEMNSEFRIPNSEFRIWDAGEERSIGVESFVTLSEIVPPMPRPYEMGGRF